jgi:predicted RNase H-like HicB family nuclease
MKEGIVEGTGYVVLTLEFRRVGRRWTAYCKELGTATFGRSLPEADKRIKEAVLLHLNTLEDVGERQRFFRENNIEFHRARPRKNITVCVSPRTSIFVEPHVQRLSKVSAA